jgi:hypothetical protein
VLLPLYGIYFLFTHLHTWNWGAFTATLGLLVIIIVVMQLLYKSIVTRKRFLEVKMNRRGIRLVQNVQKRYEQKDYPRAWLNNAEFFVGQEEVPSFFGWEYESCLILEGDDSQETILWGGRLDSDALDYLRDVLELLYKQQQIDNLIEEEATRDLGDHLLNY